MTGTDFTELLLQHGIPAERTKLLRHDWRASSALKKGRDWFGSFISYQSLENSPFRSGAEYAAHFVAGPKLPSGSSTGFFVGITKVIDRWAWSPASPPRLWLPADIIQYPEREEAVDQEWLTSDLDHTELLIDWGFSPRAWHQWALDNRKLILSQGSAASDAKRRAIASAPFIASLDEAAKREMLLRIENETIAREIDRSPETLRRLFQERLIESRPGQPAFRRALMARDGAACAVTGCEVEQALEAAHIVPFAEGRPGRDLPSNGLILRRDIHRLFDLFLLGVEPGSRTVWLDPSLRGGYYGALRGSLVEAGGPAALAEHFRLCLARAQ